MHLTMVTRYLPWFAGGLFWLAASAAQASDDRGWVERSNTLAQPVLAYYGGVSPEYGSALGLNDVDTLTTSYSLSNDEKWRGVAKRLIAELEARRSSEPDLRVQQDLQIMVDALTNLQRSDELDKQFMLPYINVAGDIFSGLQTLLDPRNQPERQALAITRLKRYVGGVAGVASLADQARSYTSHYLANPKLLGPFRRQLETDMANSEVMAEGIAQLFAAAGLDGWQADYEKLKTQLVAYRQWQQENLLPRARDDNRLPPEIYAQNLRSMGVSIPVELLEQRALVGFAEIRDEMQVLAKTIAQAQQLPDSDYRAVIRALKQRQVTGEAVLPFYQQRLQAIEAIIEKQQIVTLPARKANVRLASDAESAQQPAPHMQPPRLIGNSGEYGEFVLPLTNPTAAGVQDDFTNDGFAWTLTVHEARPGHELQFAAMVENGVSIPRAVFAFNSANVEGWALYAEAVMKEYLPVDGQLFSLQARLQRAARAFLDPMVNSGRLTPDQAKAFLMDEVVLSEPFAQQEVDRYSFRSPGQATTYYFGYLKMRELRLRTEMALGKAFNQRAFHDFVLAQGLLPPDLLALAVEREFIPSQR